MPVKTPQFQINIRKNDSVRSLAVQSCMEKTLFT